MSVFKDFLLQLSLILVPFGIYLAYVSGHLRQRKHMALIHAAIWGIAIVLCLSFPIYYMPTRHLDLRIAPLLIGTLYCGRKTGVFLALLTILYRLYSFDGTAGFISTLLAILCGFSIILYVQPLFVRAAKGKKLRMAVFLAAGYTVCGAVLVGMLSGFTALSVSVQIVHLLLAVALVWMMVHYIENAAEIPLMRKELHHAERLRLIGDLTSVFAHEIRNPLQVARGFLQLIHTPDLAESKKQYILISMEELDRANAIISEFLLLGKPISERNERVEVGIQLQKSVSLIENYASTHNVRVETHIEDGCFMNGNAQVLNQLLVNIMKNAIEAMPDGGTIFVSCTSSGGGAPIELRIKDEGVGMSAQELERLGSPYYSLKENGTGLGMMICHQIIALFGGELHVFSEERKGTEVVARIPSAQSAKP